MNLQFAASNLLRQLGALIGLVTLVSVTFEPIDVRVNGDTLRLEARLDGAVTEEIRALVGASTRVVISYEIVELFANDTQQTTIVRKALSYDALRDQYTVRREARDFADTAIFTGTATTVTASRERAEELFSRIAHTTPTESLSAVIIKADLDVPEVGDKSLVEGLWGGKVPTAVHRLESPPGSGRE